MTTIRWVVCGLCVLVSAWVGPVMHAAVAQEIEHVSAQERQELLDQAVMPFLEALRTGDVQRLEQLIGGKLALTLGTLLRENAEYPNYLRQRYGNTMVGAPIQIEREPDGMGSRSAEVQLAMPSGGQDNFLLNLEQDAQGEWKIVDKVRHH